MPVKSKLRLVTPAIENRAVAPAGRRTPCFGGASTSPRPRSSECRIVACATFVSGKVRGASNIGGLLRRVRQRHPAGNPRRRRPARPHRPTLPQWPPAQSVRRQSSSPRGRRHQSPECCCGAIEPRLWGILAGLDHDVPDLAIDFATRASFQSTFRRSFRPTAGVTGLTPNEAAFFRSIRHCDQAC
jgi:hypothetical protein